jgi:iron complex transport system ATP-binding protein
MAVVGANGAGKSTLLKIISGDLTSFEGRVNFNGKAIQTYKPEQLAPLRAVLMQEQPVNFPFTAWEVVQMGLLNQPARLNTHQVIISQVMEATQTLSFASQNYLTLSGGEKQRIQLARILAQLWSHDAEGVGKILYLDEPTSALDLAQQHYLLSFIKAITVQKKWGVVAVLHDLNLAAQYADTLLLLKKGSTIAQGSTSLVLNETNVSQCYQYPVAIIQHPKGFPLVISR